jgi:hypothetical protein
MRRIDLLIGGVIIVAILFSFVGVATYDAVAGDQDFTVVWASSSKDLAATGQRTGDGSTEVALPVPYQNLTKVDLVVRVVGAGARTNDVTVDIKVTPLNGTEQTKRVTLPRGTMGNQQEQTFTFEIGQAPNATTASGASENETLAELAAQHTSTKGMGNWKITFTVAGSNAASVPVVGAGANTYQFSTPGSKASMYSAALQPLTPDVNR